MQTNSCRLDTRLATARDASAIARIYNQGIEDRGATFETEPRTTGQIAAKVRNDYDAYPTVVVECAGRIVAWASAAQYSDRPCYRGIAEFSVYVERDRRGHGLGSAAMQALISECGRRGFWKLVARIFPENSASRALCRALGFREVGVHERHAKLDGEWRDVVIVEKLLDES